VLFSGHHQWVLFSAIGQTTTWAFFEARGGSSKSQALSDAPIPTGIPLPALYTWHRHLHREGSSLTGRWLSVRRRFRGFNHIKHTANGESYNAGWRYVGFIHGEGVWSFRLFGNVISSAVLGFGGIFRRTNHHSLYLSSTWNPFSLVKEPSLSLMLLSWHLGALRASVMARLLMGPLGTLLRRSCVSISLSPVDPWVLYPRS